MYSMAGCAYFSKMTARGGRTSAKFMTYVWIFTGIIVTVSTQNFDPADSPVIDSPPTMFKRQPVASEVELLSGSKIFLCETNGSPTLSYWWLKDGVPYSTSSPLVLKNLQKSNAGIYQCKASNNYGAVLSHKARLEVAYIEYFSATQDQILTVNQGDAITISLPSIDSIPDPEIKWFQGTTEITGQERIYKSLKNDLIILESRFADHNKVYKAQAIDTILREKRDTPKYTLSVLNVNSPTSNIPPTFIIKPSNTTAKLGDYSAVLECVVNARPLTFVSIDWYVLKAGDRKKITSADSTYKIEDFNRKLTIRRPQSSENGEYECYVSFDVPGGTRYPTLSAKANFTVYIAPSANGVISPIELQKDYGDTATVTCPVAGFPKPTIKWFRNAVPITTGMGTKYTQLDSGSIQLTSVTPDDSAIYQCFAKNEVGETDIVTNLVVVSAPAKIVKPPGAAAVIEGANVRFECEASGAPKPTIQWNKKAQFGSNIVVSGGRFQILETALLITAVDVKDAAEYECIARNAKGTDSASANLKVAIRTVIIRPPQNVDVIKGSQATMKCGVQHSPDVPVNVQWFLNAQLVTDSRMQVLADYTLQISSVRSDDIGTYRCQVTSPAGNDSKSADLKVVELPYEPTITYIALNPASDRKVDLRWSPGFDGNSPVKEFIIHERLIPPGATGTSMNTNDGWQLVARNIGADVRAYTVDNLQPAKTYQFHVTAVNSVGEGRPSLPSNTITLPQQAPSGPPTGVVGSPRSNSSIIVQWQPPEESKWNGQLKGYTIRYKPSRYPASTYQYVQIQNPSVRMRELTGLIVFLEYEVEIAAYNDKGVGAYSNSIVVRTKEGSPTAAPRNVKATALNSTSIKVTFSPPDPQKINGINQGYKVHARLPNSVINAVESIIPPEPTIINSEQVGFLHGLKKYTEYMVTVLCYTGAGEGPSSQGEQVRTLEDVPDEVENMRFEDVYDTSLKVIWNPPKNINGQLKGYTLIYGLQNQTVGQTQRDLGPSTRNFTINGLRAQTVYSIKLYARTRVGNGAAKMLDIKSGEKPELPGPPLNLDVSFYGPRSVVLQFLPGSTGKTTIIVWEIEAQVGSDKTWVKVYEEKAPNARELTVKNLIPYTYYRLRMRAVNIIGRSNASVPTNLFQTIQAVPSVAPGNVTVRAVNETAVRVRWTPLPVQDWNGLPKGYKISYRSKDLNNSYTEVSLENSNGNGYLLTGLQEWTMYEVRLRAYNIIGNGPYSPVKSDRTRESVPSAGPKWVNASATGSTTISVTWGDVPLLHQNGEITGFKVLYRSVGQEMEKVLVYGGTTRAWNLNGLGMYVMYEIQVVACTRVGDGVPSPKMPIAERTDEGVPGPPAGIYFPDVTYSTARVVWSPPTEPNGIIRGYSVAYYEEGSVPTSATVDSTLEPTRREYSVSGLKEQKLYFFTLKARTNEGWGRAVSVTVKTILNRLVPEAPHKPYIGVAGAASRVITLRWQAGFDGYSPIRNYTIQQSRDSGKTWMFYDKTVLINGGGDFVSYDVTGLKPYTKYTFRVAANNDIGRGPFSPQSDERETLQDKPDAPPFDLQVIPVTTTSVKVSWKPPAQDTWNGDLQGFKLQYRQVENPDYQIRATTATEVTLTGLNKGFNYELRISAYNGIGSGPSSPPVTVYVGEAIPAAPPKAVVQGAVLSTEAVISWAPPPQDQQNGDLLGYKVYYWSVPNNRRKRRALAMTSRRKRAIAPADVKMQAVTSSENQVRLTDLKKYTKYNVMVSAFNPAGDGPNSSVISIVTDQDAPGAPGLVTFSDILMTSLVVRWEPPKEPNGIITYYVVTYQPWRSPSGVSTIVSAKIPGGTHHYMVTNLLEDVSYLFSVKARTKVDWGPQSTGNVTTGPQKLSPKPPQRPVITVHATSIGLKWENDNSIESDITGYLIQGRLDNGTWETVLRLNSPEPNAIVPFSNLKLKTDYRFRVIALNQHGISSPSEESSPFTTPAYDSKPFYQQFWFLIIVALTAVIFIIVIIAVFLVLGRNKKKRDKKKGLSAAQSIDDGGFSTFELRASQRLPPPPPKINGTLGKSKNNYYRSGPKLGPASIYSDDDSIAKPPIPSDSSSCTEKPDDLDSVTETQASDSEPECEKPLGAHGGFVNPYVGDSIRKSWKEQHPSKAYSYTDSEPESYTLSINGGQHLHNMNNLAGSRAPLPGFSSFV
ncbi:protein sidekick-2-like isoform X2 [Lineus longissimus]|uniref:protein sidekick-2-like isoform X2 n=1 Tax=Lineus longissimus TaxID=88925 RepID=UPI00315CF0C1